MRRVESGRQPCYLESVSACSSQYAISIPRYISAALLRCSAAPRGRPFADTMFRAQGGSERPPSRLLYPSRAIARGVITAHGSLSTHGDGQVSAMTRKLIEV
jgi:hypothetical protein